MAITEQEVFEFAKTPPPEPEAPPAPEEPVAVETPPAEATPSEPVPAPEPAEAAIPSWRLREEAEARRVAEDRARTLEARLNEIATHLQQQAPKTDFFADPDAATQAIIQRYIQPQVEETRKALMYMGKMVASTAHGAEKVDEAEQAFLKAMNAQALDPMDYEKVVQSPNRYDAVVQWHQRQTVLSSVGNDPAAWFEKQLESRLADPKFQASLLEKVRTGASAKPGTVKIPPSLSRATASAGNGQEPIGDLSDPSLFAHAMKR